MKSSAWLDQIGGRLSDQLRFLLEADRLKGVIRLNHIADGSRRENTAEHSWHLALFAMVLQDYAVAPVDIWRVVQMLVLHDLVEIEAGDTPLHLTLTDHGQAAREQAAADILFGMLPADQGEAFRAIWEEFEAAESADARFAKACDRLQPILLNHVVGGGTWGVRPDFNIDMEKQLTRRIEHGSPTLWAAAEVVFADAVACGWLKPAPAPAAEG
ncbi:MAG TPA: HD domain-containing protein [Acidisoma sp.]|uniref:HD domain-containing protein n=1 Tax=Acidisoma sp. TaxID=1872115 RepID=UPI002C6C0048|nr:HD domain-containing protein [Acidisoma sp.]HTI00670.1 HD domain-containing protein [Acidisoma sp.]